MSLPIDPHRHGRPHQGHWGRHRFRRRLFAAIGVSIVLATVVSSASVSLFAGPFSDWKQDAGMVARFGSRVFAERWNPEERSRLARAMSEELRLRVEILDAQGSTLEVVGPACDRRSIEFAVDREGRALGLVRLCAPNFRHGHGFALAAWLGLFVACLWAAAGWITRRHLRPLDALVRVTERLGSGELSARLETVGDDELGLLARSVNDMAARIERQIEEQRSLLAQVSHELRTPLGHLRILTELARVDDPQTRLAALDDIDREILELDELVGELLATSRIEHSAITRRALSTKDVLESALRRVGLPSSLCQVEPGAETVLADPTLLARALANLITNATRHGQGLVTLRSRVEANADGSRWVRLEALDDGPGIPNDELDAIFRPFFRGQGASDEDRRPSLGLGLALVARVAAAHGGKAFAENRAPDKGAIVGFSLRAET
ncbi:MAG: HAMP domain-containing histidine kinase [Deltaproteobacteria bacterium]|nr:HAMP domain-containing histidine kinase [Deltaproteobacteria bacterium]